MSELNSELPKTIAAIESGTERGWHRGVQLSVSLPRNSINVAVDMSQDDAPLTNEMLLPWLSAGKPLTAVAIMRLIEAGQLELETPVVDIIPEFVATSRIITLRHLLTHTAGLAVQSSGWPNAEWNDVIRGICEGGLIVDWVPGERAGYDPVRSWFLLGEIVRRIDGRPIEQVVRDDIMLPIGMHDSWMAMPHERYVAYGDRIGRTYDVTRREQHVTTRHQPAQCESPSPGSSLRGPISELRLFYEMMLAGGVTHRGQRLLNEDTVALMTQRHREGTYDETFQHTLDFGLGVIINSNRYGVDTVPYGYGAHAAESAFGHGGARCCIGFADPQRQLVVCMMANGAPSEPQHQKRFRELLAALYDDLGITDQ